MKRTYFIPLALRSRFLLTLLFFLATCTFLAAQVSSTQSGFGRDYIGDQSLSGLVQDMGMVENESYICTVARVKHDDDNNLLDREYLLIRVRLKSNGYENCKIIELGRQAVASHSYLSVELSHDEAHAIIATSDEVDGLEAVALFKYSMAGQNIVDQDRMSYDTNVLEDYTGIEIQRRFNASGGGTGYTLAVGGVSGLKVIVVTELGENLFPNLSRLSTSDITLTGSDSNDEYMLMCGVSTNDAKLKAVRYNSQSHAFDWAMEYLVFSPQRFGDPLVAYNINESNGNRNGFFIAADEYNYMGLLRPVVFRVRNNGNMVWNKALESGTSLRGMYHSGSSCKVMTTAQPLSTGQDAYKRYALDQGSGAVIGGSSFTASIGNYYDRVVKMQEGYQSRSILMGASTYEPADWVLFKANPATIFGPAGFSCAGEQTFSVATRSVFRDNVDHNTVNSTHNWDIPTYTALVLSSSNFPCNTNKRGVAEAIETEAITTGTVFPNPVPAHNQAFSVEVNSANKVSCELLVNDLLGRTVHRETRLLQEGGNQLLVQPRGISSGVYLLRLRGENGVIFQERLVFQ